MSRTYLMSRISDTVQYDPAFNRYDLQILNVIPVEDAFAWTIHLTVSLSDGPWLKVIVHASGDESIPNLLLEALKEAEDEQFTQVLEEMLIPEDGSLER